ncbi:MAG: hypothetical protein ACI4A8_01305 [Muribaculaceae bacterium]
MIHQRLFILFTTISVLLLTSCQSGSDADEPRPEARFKLSVALADMSRNGITRSVDDFYDASGAAITDNEKMQTLRIVIVRADGTVEHNRYLDFHSRPAIWYGEEEFKVERGEDKEVYLFVNENNSTYYESTGLTVALSDNNFIREGATFPTDRVKNLTVKTTSNTDVLSGPLPMCEHHTIKAEALGRDTTLFVTRAATKFTYVIKNELDKTINWSALSLDKVARKEYYLPNNTTYTFTKDASGEIIKGEVENYEVATIQNNEHYTFTRSFDAISVAKGEEKALESFYLLESKYDDPDTTDPSLNYKTSITLDGIDFDSRYLTNLSQLPRNSHVVVYITVKNDYQISCTVDVRPYGEIILEPGFGQ